MAVPSTAIAQDEGRFFFDGPETDEPPTKTKFRGSLTLSTFYYNEFGRQFTAPAANEEPPSDRLLSDLRVLLDAEHIGGGSVDVKLDFRGRFAAKTCSATDDELDTVDPCTRLQSGALSGNELDVREAYVRRSGANTDFALGRHLVLEVASTKFDGVRVDHRRSEKWRLLGFAGLYPSRIARDVRQDYPDSAVQNDGTTKRVMPIIVGAGAAYRYQKLYGSVGAAFIKPLTEDSAAVGGSGTLETQRIFVSGTGFYRQGAKFDLYHNLVVDLTGADELALTNLNLGVNLRPNPALRAFVQLNRVDTEVLNVLIQDQLQNPETDTGMVADAVQNNIAVQRAAQESVRTGVTADLRRNRFAVGASFALRRRPEVTVNGVAGTAQLQLEAAQAADVTINIVDRQSFKGLRIGGTVTRSFGIGDAVFERSNVLSVILDGRREIADGKGEIEASVSFVQSTDKANVMGSCGVAALQNCYGGSKATTFGLGGLVYYRIKPKLFAIGSLNLSRQLLETDVPEPTIDGGPSRTYTPITLFVRLAYRL